MFAPLGCAAHSAPSQPSVTPASPTIITSSAPLPHTVKSPWLAGSSAGSAAADHAAPSQRSSVGASITPSPPTAQISPGFAPHTPQSITFAPVGWLTQASPSRRSAVPS